MTKDISVLDSWLADRPYLKEVAGLQQTIDNLLGNVPSKQIPPFHWDSLSEDFKDGIPFLRKRNLDETVVAPAAELFALLARELPGYEIPEEMKRISSSLNDILGGEPGLAASLIREASAGSESKPLGDGSIPPGALRFLAWRSLERVLRPWVATLDGWLQEATWGKPYCPLCASKPTMTQLVNTDKGRQKFLSCGCCRSRWGYLRTSCPFCGNHDQDKLDIFEIPQEENFRIDLCRECNGYIKTYISEGDEDLFLADWSTLHLDVIARQQGFKRMANSLYEL